MLIFWLRKVTLRGHINSVKWPPHPQARVPPSTKGGRGVDTLSCGWGANSDDWRKSLALCLLCATYKRNTKSAKWILLYSIQSAHQLRTMTLRGHINFVKSLYVVTPTPYHECTQLVQNILWLNWIKVTWRSQQTAFIHSTELVWPRTFMVRSWCDHVKWLYGVQKSK